MNFPTIIRSAAIAVSALFISSAALASGPAPNPQRAQQKYLAAAIRHDARTQPFYRDASRPRHVAVSFGRAVNPETGKRNGAPRATALVSAGRSFYNPKVGTPIQTRNYTIQRAQSGRLYARAITPWRPVYTALRTAR